MRRPRSEYQKDLGRAHQNRVLVWTDVCPESRRGEHIPRVHRGAAVRGGRRHRARARPPPRLAGAGRPLGGRAGGGQHHHQRVPPLLPPHRARRPRARGEDRRVPARRPARRRRLEPLRGRPRQPVRDDQGLLRHEGGGGVARRRRDGAGAGPHPRARRPRGGQRLHQDPPRPLRRVRLVGHPRDAGGDHAPAPVVVLQSPRGLLLVAHRHRPDADPDGRQAGAPAARRPAPRRAVGGAARGGQPALPPRPPPVLASNLPVEEPLHRGGRCAEELGAAGAAPAAGARARGGPPLARGAPRGAGRARRNLPGHGQLRARAALPRLSGRPPPHSRPAEGDRGARDRDRTHAALPALRLAGLGHRARRQCPHRTRGSPPITPPSSGPASG